MKRYIILLLVAVVALAGCKREEENFFDRSAAERAQDAMINARTIMPSATNGWDMYYFANPYSSGVHMTLKFNTNGQVAVTGEHSMRTSKGTLKTDTASVWDIVNDLCPILTFNTYNDVLHFWSDPLDDGVGYEGDYEFIILEASKDIVRLKGKKYGAYSFMFPIPADKTEEAVFSESTLMSKRLFSNGNILTYSDNDNLVNLYGGTTGIFEVTEYDKAPGAEDPESYTFIPTSDGIFFNDGFRKNKTTRYLLTDEGLQGGTATISAGPLGDYMQRYMVLNEAQWNISVTNVCDSTSKLLADLLAYYQKSKPKSVLRDFTIHYVASKYEGEPGTYVLTYTYSTDGKKNASGKFVFDVQFDKETITLQYKEPYDDAGKNIINNANIGPLLTKVFEAMKGTYDIATTTEKINPTLGISITNQQTTSLVWYLTGTEK